MRDYAVRMNQNSAEPPGPFIVGRGVAMPYQVLHTPPGEDETALDLSVGRWSVLVRAYERGATEILLEDELTISPEAGAEGYLDHYFSCGATAYPKGLHWEFVLVDGSNADASTKSQQREYVLLEWIAAILPAPTA